MKSVYRLQIISILTILSVAALFTKTINHNSIGLLLSLYLIFEFGNKQKSVLRAALFASLVTALNAIPFFIMSLPLSTFILVFLTSFGLFTSFSLTKSLPIDELSKLKLLVFIDTILAFTGTIFLSSILLGVNIESWRLLNIDTNGFGFYVFSLSVCRYLLAPRFSPVYITSLIYLFFASNTYYIMTSLFLLAVQLSIYLSLLKNLKIKRKYFILSAVAVSVLLLVVTTLLEFDRIYNAARYIFFSTGSFKNILETDPRRYYLTLQGMELLNIIAQRFPLNITGVGYSTLNYQVAIDFFSSSLGNIDTTGMDLNARPHNIFVSLPVVIGFPAASLLLFIALRSIFSWRYPIACAALMSILVGLAFNEFISIPSIYLIFGISRSLKSLTHS